MAATVLQSTTAPANAGGAGGYVVKVGIIGGTGLDDPDLLKERTEKSVSTPFGQPSSAIVCGNIGGVPVAMLARHGKGHTINPTNVNYRANVYALKAEGCTHLLVSTACGILHDDIKPGDFVLLDQCIDRTQKRAQTFYDGDVLAGHPKGVCHIPMSDPFDKETGEIVLEVAKTMPELKMHPKGTMLTIEGPRFSTRAESHFWRLLKADVVNMTTVPEVVLAAEAGLCYCAIAMGTDYDCWKDTGEAVDVAAVLAVMKENAVKMKKLWLAAVVAIGQKATKAAIDNRQGMAKNNVMGGD